MWNTSRDLRETVIRAMAKVGLVWAVAVLGALFMLSSAAGTDAHTAAASVTTEAPRTAGLALALVVLGGGVTVLVIGASRERAVLQRKYAAEPDPAPTPNPASDLPLALGLGLLA